MFAEIRTGNKTIERATEAFACCVKQGQRHARVDATDAAPPPFSAAAIAVRRGAALDRGSGLSGVSGLGSAPARAPRRLPATCHKDHAIVALFN